MTQGDLFTDDRRPEVDQGSERQDPEPQRGPGQDASQQLGDTAPASLAAGKWQPVIDPTKRPRFDCSMMKRHDTARNIPREFDEQERRAQASEERKRNKSGHMAPSRTARQIAADMDAERQGETPDNAEDI